MSLWTVECKPFVSSRFTTIYVYNSRGASPLSLGRSRVLAILVMGLHFFGKRRDHVEQKLINGIAGTGQFKNYQNDLSIDVAVSPILICRRTTARMY